MPSSDGKSVQKSRRNEIPKHAAGPTAAHTPDTQKARESSLHLRCGRDVRVPGPSFARPSGPFRAVPVVCESGSRRRESRCRSNVRPRHRKRHDDARSNLEAARLLSRFASLRSFLEKPIMHAS